MKREFHSETFEKISSEKRDRILTVTISEFAKNGFAGTSINTIAKKADISIGSLYSYFDSKESLFLAMVQKGYELLERAIGEVHAEEGSFWDKLERLFKVAYRYSKKHPDMNKLYLNLSHENLGPMMQESTAQLEKCFLDVYTQMIDEGLSQGELREDLDRNMAMFTIDNLVVMLQFSLSADYFKRRFIQFLGSDLLDDEEKLTGQMVEILRHALRGGLDDR